RRRVGGERASPPRVAPLQSDRRTPDPCRRHPTDRSADSGRCAPGRCSPKDPTSSTSDSAAFRLPDSSDRSQPPKTYEPLSAAPVAQPTKRVPKTWKNASLGGKSSDFCLLAPERYAM